MRKDRSSRQLLTLSTLLASLIIAVLIMIVIHYIATIPEERHNASSIYMLHARWVKISINTSLGHREVTSRSIIEVPHTSCIVFRPILVDYYNVDRIVVEGYAILKSLSSNVSYRVYMPCAVIVNTSCFRVQIIIPGYDYPLRIRRGVYEVTYHLSWTANGEGKVTVIMTYLLYTCSSKATIDVLAGKSPSNFERWHVANGSTRMYFLAISNLTVYDSYGVFNVCAWQFTPEVSRSLSRYVIYLYDNQGALTAYAVVPVEKVGFYYQVCLRVKVRTGTYRLVVRFPLGNKCLSVPVVAYRCQGNTCSA